MRKLNNIITNNFEFGDWFLYQQYDHIWDKDIKQYKYMVSKPIMAMFIQWWPCDQTVDVEHLIWSKYGIHRKNQIAANVQWFAEWMDYGDVLGHWKHKPSWKEIIVAYRKQNKREFLLSEEIDWSR